MAYALTTNLTACIQSQDLKLVDYFMLCFLTQLKQGFYSSHYLYHRVAVDIKSGYVYINTYTYAQTELQLCVSTCILKDM